LYIKNTYGLTAQIEGQGHFGTGVGEVWVVEVNRVRPNVESDAGIARLSNIANDAGLTNLKLMATLEHPLATFAVCGL
jgi:hypothetical protein